MYRSLWDPIGHPNMKQNKYFHCCYCDLNEGNVWRKMSPTCKILIYNLATNTAFDIWYSDSVFVSFSAFMIHAWPLKVQRPWPCLVLKMAERTQLKFFWLKSSKRLNAVQKNQDNGRYQKYPEEGRVKSSLEKPSVRWSIGNQWKSAVRPYITKSYFETYKLYDHMQKIRPIHQKYNEILRFENFEIMRFCIQIPSPFWRVLWSQN